MLASDEEGGTLDALRFSLASEIVELVVLTGDEAFLQTLREAVGDAQRLWHVPSADKVSDLLVAGEVGILVLDVLGLSESPMVFIAQIKRQFPDLVIVVAGNRDAEIALAGLISAGTVYRFIHKPVSPARAKLFADAAVKKYEEQRRRAASTPKITRTSPDNRGPLIVGAIGVLGIIVVIAWAIHRSAENSASIPHAAAPPASASASASASESPLLAQAAAALAANRLTEPVGDNALELYRRAQARDPSDPKARAGLAELYERLLARAENALLEERLDEAALAIETARKAGVERGRITFLTAQLARSRERLLTAQAAHLHDEVKPDAAQDAKRALAMRLLAEASAAIDRRDFERASGVLEAAKGVAAPANIETAEVSLAAARRLADTDAWSQLLKTGEERLQQDRLIEPANDSAKYYLVTLRGMDPGNSRLATAMQDLGARLVAKARLALALEQYDAARSWLDEAAAIGFESAESDTLHHGLEAALSRQHFLTNVAAAGDLQLLKSVKPEYPQKANLGKIQGWVELDFTVAEDGQVKDIAVHATSPPGVFESAAIGALSQWRYKPILRDGKIVAQRARIRIRFALTD
ncbi:MAG: TonB family protein [Gammaproteobacteria bacterium]